MVLQHGGLVTAAELIAKLIAAYEMQDPEVEVEFYSDMTNETFIIDGAEMIDGKLIITGEPE